MKCRVLVNPSSGDGGPRLAPTPHTGEVRGLPCGRSQSRDYPNDAGRSSDTHATCQNGNSAVARGASRGTAPGDAVNGRRDGQRRDEASARSAPLGRQTLQNAEPTCGTEQTCRRGEAVCVTRPSVDRRPHLAAPRGAEKSFGRNESYLSFGRWLDERSALLCLSVSGRPLTHV